MGSRDRKCVTERPGSDPGYMGLPDSRSSRLTFEAPSPELIDSVRMPPRISVFPKFHFDELVSRSASFEQWIRDAATLGGEGIEHYDGFFRSLSPADVDPIARLIESIGQHTSMICFSPDFTHPDAAERGRQVERQKAAIDLTVRLGARHCRTLSGQRYPGLSREDGIARTLDGI